jgi:hypothetical protein
MADVVTATQLDGVEMTLGLGVTAHDPAAEIFDNLTVHASPWIAHAAPPLPSDFRWR